MSRIVVSVFALFLCVSGIADEKHTRPRILGIDRVEFYSTNIAGARDFYSRILSPEGTCILCEQAPLSPLHISLTSNQLVTLSTPPPPAPPNLLYEVDFLTDDVTMMKKYLQANNIAVQERGAGGEKFLVAIDPEGHRIGFGKPARITTATLGLGNMRVIHAGFVVRDRTAEDKFYKDVLGFHVYWHGGMKEGEDNWVDMQVPDGSDWIEYMLKVPDNATHKQLGVMNHIALGVPDIHAAQQQLIKNGWKGTEEPKIGRDGKWQLNLYDPDETRVEMMEFKPTKEPCCSAYTGPHPGP
jgi:catechol 2,3-dioxygenase-like lactoylglutathione lyase family enzyme